MPLPKCVKIDYADKEAVSALLEDDWRDVGTLVTFRRGPTSKEIISRPAVGNRLEAIAMAGEIKWSGRLFRDGLSLQGLQRIYETIEDENNKLYLNKQGFVVYHVQKETMPSRTVRIILVGVLPSLRLMGVAKNLIESVSNLGPSESLAAGTYHDNIDAIWLYLGLGMKPIRKQIVFHK